MKPLSETEVRFLRDAVFWPPDKNSTPASRQSNWESCREWWMRPDEIAWLRDQFGKEHPERCEQNDKVSSGAKNQ